MKPCLLTVLLAVFFYSPAYAELPEASTIKIPLVKRASRHHAYAYYLLNTALQLTQNEYGPFIISQGVEQSTINRQLQDLSKGDLSVAISMPTHDWNNKADRVQFPLLKGLASYRLFLVLKKNKHLLNHINTVNDLKSFSIGQGVGWSTSKILEAHNFKVVYSVSYDSLFKMLHAGRYQLLMRGVYEAEAELEHFNRKDSALSVVDNFGLYTYLPMYFYTSKTQPELAKRLSIGLKRANDNGELDNIFNLHFSSSVSLLNLETRKILYITNTNISPNYKKQDAPYLLNSVNREARKPLIKSMYTLR